MFKYLVSLLVHTEQEFTYIFRKFITVQLADEFTLAPGYNRSNCKEREDASNSEMLHNIWVDVADTLSNVNGEKAVKRCFKILRVEQAQYVFKLRQRSDEQQKHEGEVLV